MPRGGERCVAHPRLMRHRVSAFIQSILIPREHFNETPPPVTPNMATCGVETHRESSSVCPVLTELLPF